ncbi:MAG TPA: hypothetical protein VKU01_20735 [Bryobacteraceae bacterium]|nr:hypothetical protein [Bryobacteraceae bacterium]
MEREIPLGNGSRIRAKVELGFTHLGELTTEDQRTYYALVKQWETSGRPAQQTFFSIRGLARFLNKKWGTNVIEAVTESLRRLRATPFTWQNAYHDGVSRETIEELDTFNILSELKVIRQKSDGHVTREAGYFRFNDQILRNLIARHTKPVLFDTILRFKSEIAQLLYTHLDLILADKRHYERRTKELFEDLGLRAKEYGRINERKRTLERALQELRSAPLSTGVISEAYIERTQDRKDYKLCVSKASSLFKIAVIQKPSRGEVTVLSAAKSAVETQAEELVLHFHKIFHNVNRVLPQSKEVNQAISLIAQYGFDPARYVVDFSFQAAAKTDYAPQTFGGILQYTAQAIASYEKNQREIEVARKNHAKVAERQNWDALQAKIDDARRRQAQESLEKMSEDERQALFAKTRDRLVSRSPWIANSANSKTVERIIRGAIIAELVEAMPAEEPPRTQTS